MLIPRPKAAARALLIQRDTQLKWRGYQPTFAGWPLTTWMLFVLLLVCDGCFHPVLSDPIAIWATYLPENSDIPGASVLALAQSPDGALWVGTGGGLGRLDKKGHLQTYTTANTNGGLAYDHVHSLAQTSDGALWVGTGGGLSRLDKEGHWQTSCSGPHGVRELTVELLRTLRILPK